jgi:F0F1-type ATP synthase gamma subunit
LEDTDPSFSIFRTRQASITTELTEIISGASALEG